MGYISFPLWKNLWKMWKTNGTKPGQIRDNCGKRNVYVNQYSVAPLPPLPKGRWPGECRVGGILCRSAIYCLAEESPSHHHTVVTAPFRQGGHIRVNYHCGYPV